MCLPENPTDRGATATAHGVSTDTTEAADQHSTQSEAVTPRTAVRWGPVSHRLSDPLALHQSPSLEEVVCWHWNTSPPETSARTRLVGGDPLQD